MRVSELVREIASTAFLETDGNFDEALTLVLEANPEMAPQSFTEEEELREAVDAILFPQE